MPEEQKNSLTAAFLKRTAGIVVGATSDYISNTFTNTDQVRREVVKGFNSLTESITNTAKIAEGLKGKSIFKSIFDWYMKSEDEFGADDGNMSLSFDTPVDKGKETEDQSSLEAELSPSEKSAKSVNKTIVETSQKTAEVSLAVAASTVSAIESQNTILQNCFNELYKKLDAFKESVESGTRAQIETAVNAANKQDTINDMIRSRQFKADTYSSQLKEKFKNIKIPGLGMTIGDTQLGAQMLETGISAATPEMIASFALEMVLEKVGVQKSLKTLDKEISQAVVNELTRIGSSTESGWIGGLARFFGIQEQHEDIANRKAEINLGPMQFNGKANEAITTVIPGYLSEILSAINGQTQKIWDYQAGKFTTKKEWKENALLTIGSDLTNNLYDASESIKNVFKNASRFENMAYDSLIAALGTKAPAQRGQYLNKFVSNQEYAKDFMKNQVFVGLDTDRISPENLDTFLDRFVSKIATIVNSQDMRPEFERSIIQMRGKYINAGNSLVASANASGLNPEELLNTREFIPAYSVQRQYSDPSTVISSLSEEHANLLNDPSTLTEEELKKGKEIIAKSKNAAKGPLRRLFGWISNKVTGKTDEDSVTDEELSDYLYMEGDKRNISKQSVISHLLNIQEKNKDDEMFNSGVNYTNLALFRIFERLRGGIKTYSRYNESYKDNVALNPPKGWTQKSNPITSTLLGGVLSDDSSSISNEQQRAELGLDSNDTTQTSPTVQGQAVDPNTGKPMFDENGNPIMSVVGTGAAASGAVAMGVLGTIGALGKAIISGDDKAVAQLTRTTVRKGLTGARNFIAPNVKDLTESMGNPFGYIKHLFTGGSYEFIEKDKEGNKFKNTVGTNEKGGIFGWIGDRIKTSFSDATKAVQNWSGSILKQFNYEETEGKESTTKTKMNRIFGASLGGLAGAGILGGPIAILIGATVGNALANTGITTRLKNFLFGREIDKDGIKGKATGILSKLNDAIIDPIRYMMGKTVVRFANVLRHHVFYPLSNLGYAIRQVAVKGFKEGFGLIAKSFIGVSKWILKPFLGIGKGLMNMGIALFSPILRAMGVYKGAKWNLMGSLFSAPINAITRLITPWGDEGLKQRRAAQKKQERLDRENSRYRNLSTWRKAKYASNAHSLSDGYLNSDIVRSSIDTNQTLADAIIEDREIHTKADEVIIKTFGDGKIPDRKSDSEEGKKDQQTETLLDRINTAEQKTEEVQEEAKEEKHNFFGNLFNIFSPERNKAEIEAFNATIDTNKLFHEDNCAHVNDPIISRLLGEYFPLVLKALGKEVPTFDPKRTSPIQSTEVRDSQEKEKEQKKESVRALTNVASNIIPEDGITTKESTAYVNILNENAKATPNENKVLSEVKKITINSAKNEGESNNGKSSKESGGFLSKLAGLGKSLYHGTGLLGGLVTVLGGAATLLSRFNFAKHLWNATGRMFGDVSEGKLDENAPLYGANMYYGDRYDAQADSLITMGLPGFKHRKKTDAAGIQVSNKDYNDKQLSKFLTNVRYRNYNAYRNSDEFQNMIKADQYAWDDNVKAGRPDLNGGRARPTENDEIYRQQANQNFRLTGSSLAHGIFRQAERGVAAGVIGSTAGGLATGIASALGVEDTNARMIGKTVAGSSTYLLTHSISKQGKNSLVDKFINSFHNFMKKIGSLLRVNKIFEKIGGKIDKLCDDIYEAIRGSATKLVGKINAKLAGTSLAGIANVLTMGSGYVYSVVKGIASGVCGVEHLFQVLPGDADGLMTTISTILTGVFSAIEMTPGIGWIIAVIDIIDDLLRIKFKSGLKQTLAQWIYRWCGEERSKTLDEKQASFQKEVDYYNKTYGLQGESAVDANTFNDMVNQNGIMDRVFSGKMERDENGHLVGFDEAGHRKKTGIASWFSGQEYDYERNPDGSIKRDSEGKAIIKKDEYGRVQKKDKKVFDYVSNAGSWVWGKLFGRKKYKTDENGNAIRDDKGNLVEDTENNETGVFGAVRNGIGSIISNIAPGLGEWIQGLGQQTRSLFQFMTDGFTSLFNTLSSQLDKFGEGSNKFFKFMTDGYISSLDQMNKDWKNITKTWKKNNEADRANQVLPVGGPLDGIDLGLNEINMKNNNDTFEMENPFDGVGGPNDNFEKELFDTSSLDKIPSENIDLNEGKGDGNPWDRGLPAAYRQYNQANYTTPQQPIYSGMGWNRSATQVLINSTDPETNETTPVEISIPNDNKPTTPAPKIDFTALRNRSKALGNKAGQALTSAGNAVSGAVSKGAQALHNYTEEQRQKQIEKEAEDQKKAAEEAAKKAAADAQAAATQTTTPATNQQTPKPAEVQPQAQPKVQPDLSATQLSSGTNNTTTTTTTVHRTDTGKMKSNTQNTTVNDKDANMRSNQSMFTIGGTSPVAYAKDNIDTSLTDNIDSSDVRNRTKVNVQGYTSNQKDKSLWEMHKGSIISKGTFNPVKDKDVKITSGYAWRKQPNTGQPNSGKVTFHGGVDLVPTDGSGRSKTPPDIISNYPGKVIRSRFHSGGAGQYVSVQTDSGPILSYMHMVQGSQTVKEGDRVEPGKTLGKLGTTGGSTGPHLHYQINMPGTDSNDKTGTLDPFKFLTGDVGLDGYSNPQSYITKKSHDKSEGGLIAHTAGIIGKGILKGTWDLFSKLIGGVWSKAKQWLSMITGGLIPYDPEEDGSVEINPTEQREYSYRNSTVDNVSDFIALCKKEIGQQERPEGSYRTKYSEWYFTNGELNKFDKNDIQPDGYNANLHWDLIFALWCFNNAGLPTSGKARDCDKFRDIIRKVDPKLFAQSPQIGDLVIFKTYGEGQNADIKNVRLKAGIVTAVSGTSITILEGNSVMENPAWELYGSYVREKTRNINSCETFIRLVDFTILENLKDKNAAKVNSNVASIYAYLRKLGFNDEAAAGILGCWQQESSIKPRTVEGDYKNEFSSTYGGYDMINDREKMNKYVTNFLTTLHGIQDVSKYQANDGNYYPGLGLAQWTGGRGKNLLDKLGNKWDDPKLQIDLMMSELESRKLSIDAMNKIKNPEEAAVLWSKNFEGYGLEKGLAKRRDSARNLFKQLAGRFDAIDSSSSFNVQGEAIAKQLEAETNANEYVQDLLQNDTRMPGEYTSVEKERYQAILDEIDNGARDKKSITKDALLYSMFTTANPSKEDYIKQGFPEKVVTDAWEAYQQLSALKGDRTKAREARETEAWNDELKQKGLIQTDEQLRDIIDGNFFTESINRNAINSELTKDGFVMDKFNPFTEGDSWFAKNPGTNLQVLRYLKAHSKDKEFNWLSPAAIEQLNKIDDNALNAAISGQLEQIVPKKREADANEQAAIKEAEAASILIPKQVKGWPDDEQGRTDHAKNTLTRVMGLLSSLDAEGKVYGDIEVKGKSPEEVALLRHYGKDHPEIKGFESALSEKQRTESDKLLDTWIPSRGKNDGGPLDIEDFNTNDINSLDKLLGDDEGVGGPLPGFLGGFGGGFTGPGGARPKTNMTIGDLLNIGRGRNTFGNIRDRYLDNLKKTALGNIGIGKVPKDVFSKEGAKELLYRIPLGDAAKGTILEGQTIGSVREIPKNLRNLERDIRNGMKGTGANFRRGSRDIFNGMMTDILNVPIDQIGTATPDIINKSTGNLGGLIGNTMNDYNRQIPKSPEEVAGKVIPPAPTPEPYRTPGLINQDAGKWLDDVLRLPQTISMDDLLNPLKGTVNLSHQNYTYKNSRIETTGPRTPATIQLPSQQAQTPQSLSYKNPFVASPTNKPQTQVVSEPQLVQAVNNLVSKVEELLIEQRAGNNNTRLAATYLNNMNENGIADQKVRTAISDLSKLQNTQSNRAVANRSRTASVLSRGGAI